LSATRDEPDDLQASLAYGKWREAMNEEHDALMKNKTVEIGTSTTWHKYY
jgi:hypothetical protein